MLLDLTMHKYINKVSSSLYQWSEKPWDDLGKHQYLLPLVFIYRLEAIVLLQYSLFTGGQTKSLGMRIMGIIMGFCLAIETTIPFLWSIDVPVIPVTKCIIFPQMLYHKNQYVFLALV